MALQTQREEHLAKLLVAKATKRTVGLRKVEGVESKVELHSVDVRSSRR